MAQSKDKEGEMVFPRKVLIGRGYTKKLPELCTRLGLGKKVLIVTGRKTKTVMADKIYAELSREFQCEMVIEDEATRDAVDDVKENAHCDFMIAVGGGSKIDIAKLASHELGVPFISAPTTASHDGLASPRASLKDRKGSISIEASVPLAIVADTEVVARSPYRLTISGCADLMAKKSSIKDWELAHRLRNAPYSSFAAALAMLACDTIIENSETIKEGLEESVWIVLKSLVLSGVSMSIAGSSRPASGAEHLFAHALDRINPGKALHGEECGVGTILTLFLHGGDWELIKQTLKKLNAPTTARELGVSGEDIIEALTRAHTIRKDRYTILGDQGINRGAAERAATATGLI